jgi:ABC-type multidrug transport system fused ATPase/permease subunit
VLFAGSIAENIAYGINPDIKMDQSTVVSEKPLDAACIKRMVEDAAKQTNAHDFNSTFLRATTPTWGPMEWR